MEKKVTKIGVMTSGGDSPGMNACIRAVVRTGIYHELEVYGITRGYSGMIDNDIQRMDSRSVANIIQRGGTILKTARCKEFMTPEGRAKAYSNLKSHGIDGLVIIGGDGSFKVAQFFSNEFDIPCIGIPGTIDKDLAGTDFTIGFDTAVNTAIEAIDKIRDTADAHDRLFIVEVMGRDAGYIALHSGIGTGAEHILIPERKTDVEAIIASLQEKERRKKLVNIVVVAEGDDFGGGTDLANIIKERIPAFDIRVAILGHIQRGGKPSANDRILASTLGNAAVEQLIAGNSNACVGVVNAEVVVTPFHEAIYKSKSINQTLWNLSKILSN